MPKKAFFYRLWSLIRLSRPSFLSGGFLLHGLGVIMALYEGVSLSWPAVLWGQIAITAIQLLTHYSNEYFDLAADQANQTPTNWSGGSRVLVEGAIRPGLALALALSFGVVGLAATLILAFGLRRGPFSLPLLLLSLALAWSYSSPPLRLHSQGVGELTTAILVPGLTPIVGYYLQAGHFTWLPLLVVLPLGCFQFVMLLTIEFPDEAGDAQVGKRTLVVRLGGAKAAKLLLGVLGLAYGLLVVLLPAGLPPLVGLALIVVGGPIAAWLAWQMGHGAWAVPGRWNSLGFGGGSLLISSLLAELFAFGWLISFGG